jgi:hypothetical protein
MHGAQYRRMHQQWQQTCGPQIDPSDSWEQMIAVDALIVRAAARKPWLQRGAACFKAQALRLYFAAQFITLRNSQHCAIHNHFAL